MALDTMALARYAILNHAASNPLFVWYVKISQSYGALLAKLLVAETEKGGE